MKRGRSTGPSVDAWLAELSRGEGARAIRALLAADGREQLRSGYGHTLREIAQQPLTWEVTARQIDASRKTLIALLERSGLRDGTGALVLTGSGSSHHVGECLALPLQAALGVPAQALPAGLLLTHADACVLPDRPALVVSFGRSGDSPESAAVIDHLLADRPLVHHLLVTCNRSGRMAIGYRGEPRVLTLVLDDMVNDRSLVMTSSFTNMFVAARSLDSLGQPAAHEQRCLRLAAAGRRLLRCGSDCLSVAARGRFRTAVFLGSGARYGSAREAALKMLEMTAGRVTAFAESFLGLRHGPLSAVHDHTLIVAFLAHDHRTRAFEIDLLRELQRKRLGAGKVVVGLDVPSRVLGLEDLVVEVPEMAGLGDADMPAIDVLVAQLLGFFRCRHEGLRPDNPSPNGVINRVVGTFKLHRRARR